MNPFSGNQNDDRQICSQSKQVGMITLLHLFYLNSAAWRIQKPMEVLKFVQLFAISATNYTLLLLL